MQPWLTCGRHSSCTWQQAGPISGRRWSIFCNTAEERRNTKWSGYDSCLSAISHSTLQAREPSECRTCRPTSSSASTASRWICGQGTTAQRPWTSRARCGRLRSMLAGAMAQPSAPQMRQIEPSIGRLGSCTLILCLPDCMPACNFEPCCRRCRQEMDACPILPHLSHKAAF